MGFFDNLGKSISSAFKSVKSTVSNVVQSKEFKSVVSDVKSAVVDVYNTGKSIVTTPARLADKALDKGADLISKGEDTIGGLGKSLAIPLAIGAVVIVLVLLKK